MNYVNYDQILFSFEQIILSCMNQIQDKSLLIKAELRRVVPELYLNWPSALTSTVSVCSWMTMKINDESPFIWLQNLETFFQELSQRDNGSTEFSHPICR